MLDLCPIQRTRATPSHHNFIFAKSPGSSSSGRVPSVLPLLGGTDVDPDTPPVAADAVLFSDPAEDDVAGERDDELADAFEPSREDEPEAVDVALDAPFGSVDVASFLTTVRFSARAFPTAALLLLR